MESLLDKFTMKLNTNVFPSIAEYTGTIFHYTSTNNINPILLNDNEVILWASRYDCLNDASEGTIPQIRFSEVCEDLRQRKQISEVFYNLICDVMPTKTDLIFPTFDHYSYPYRGEYDAYIISFSETDDALAMWNYYSKGNRYEGVNIGIRTRILLDNLKLNGLREGKIKVDAYKVVYDDNKQREIISDFVEELYSKFETGDENYVRFHISSMLATLKLLFKNRCFEHEKEVRVVVKIFKKYKSEIPLKYRSYAGYIIPYIELRFDKGAVCQLTMGPMACGGQQKSVIHEMLESNGYYITEKYSEIPVRY